MGRPLVAYTSDWHCSRSAWKRVDHPEGDSYCSLRQIVDFCLEWKTPLVAGGDLFDDLKPDTHTLRFAFDQMDRMRAARLPVLFTQAQHDRADPPYLSLHPWPTYIHNRLVEVPLPDGSGLKVFGLDHTPFDRLQEALAAVPEGVDLLVVHQVWKDFMGFGAEGELAWAAARKPKAILTGDYHVHRQILVDGVPVYSPGSMAMMDVSESERKYFYTLCDDGNVMSVSLRCRPVVRVEVRSEGALEDLLGDLDGLCREDESVPEGVRKPILAVSCPPAMVGAATRVRKVLGSRAFLFWKVLEDPVVRVELPEGVAAPEPAASRTREECLAEATGGDASLYRDVLDLLTRDPKEVLAAIESRFTEPRAT